MTDQEKQEFFEQVKGKKIRTNSWERFETMKRCYFIPEEIEIIAGLMSGKFYMDDNAVPFSAVFWNGFKKDDFGHYWEFYDKVDINIDEIHKCTCSIQDLMLRGCKCGGK